MGNCNCNKKVHPATITPVLAAGSVASPYYVQVNISQRLCKKTCVGKTPVFNPQFSLVSYDLVGAGRYVATIHVEGIIGYTPCESNGCCDKTQVLQWTVRFNAFEGVILSHKKSSSLMFMVLVVKSRVIPVTGGPPT